MISFVSGPVVSIGPDVAVIAVGGIGLSVGATPNTLAGLRIGEVAHLAACLIVREESLTLYGFATDDERVVFEQLLAVSGIGARLAQGILAVHEPDALRRAVATEDLTALMKVSGIGRKGAQRIVLELSGRLGPPRGLGGGVPAQSGPVEDTWRDQVHGALLNLGWSTREAEQALDTVAADASESGSATEVATMLRMALKTLGRGA